MPDKDGKPIQRGPEEGGRMSRDIENVADQEPHPGIKPENLKREGEPRERESKSTAGMGNQQGGKARTR